MSSQTFDHRPSVELLQVLARGSLRQNLPKAVRLWVILRSLYGDEADAVKLQLGEQFTYSDWSQQFFTQTNTDHKDYKIPANHDHQCPCAKTISDWLFDENTGVDAQQWQHSFLKLYPMPPQQLENLLSTGIIPGEESGNQQKHLPNGRLFAVTSKNLQYDFQTLAELGWLYSFKQYSHPAKKTKKPPGNSFHGLELLKADRKQWLKYWSQTQLIRLFFQLGFAVLERLLQLENWDAQHREILYLVIILMIGSRKFTYLYGKIEKTPSIILDTYSPETGNFIAQPDFAEIADNYVQPINGVTRFLMHVEYVVSPEANPRISELQDQLKEIWSQSLVPPISIVYESASLARTGKRIIYPVCIYYFHRAPYLCGFGQKPKNKNDIDWHNYRLDRIQQIERLTWEDLNVPVVLKQKCQHRKPPSPEDIQAKMVEAWGFDFYQPSRKILLRFERDFHDRYIINSFRHDTFRVINDKTQFRKFIKEYAPNRTEKELLANILASLPEHPDDDEYPYAYYSADYRLHDNNVIMRLRAWGQKVEVLLPGELRERMAKDIQETWQLYHS